VKRSRSSENEFFLAICSGDPKKTFESIDVEHDQVDGLVLHAGRKASRTLQQHNVCRFFEFHRSLDDVNAHRFRLSLHQSNLHSKFASLFHSQRLTFENRGVPSINAIACVCSSGLFAKQRLQGKIGNEDAGKKH